MKYLDVIKRHLQFGNRKLVFTREGFYRLQLLWNTIKKRMITGFDYSEILSCDFDPDTYRLVKVVVKVDGNKRSLTFIQSTYNAELDMTTENCVIDLNSSQFKDLDSDVNNTARDLYRNSIRESRIMWAGRALSYSSLPDVMDRAIAFKDEGLGMDVPGMGIPNPSGSLYGSERSKTL